MRYPLICKGITAPGMFKTGPKGEPTEEPFIFTLRQWLVELILADKAWRESNALVDLNLKLQDKIEAGDFDEGKCPALTDADHEILDRLCRSIDPQVLPAFQVLKLKFLRFVSCIGNAPSTAPEGESPVEHKALPPTKVKAKQIEAFKNDTFG